MRKLFIILIFFLVMFNFNNSTQLTVMNEVNNINGINYELIFDEENLNLRNIKLKLALFSNHDSYIKKIYIKYNNNVNDFFDKEYFSFDNRNFSDGINKIIYEYNLVLKENYLYEELDKDISNVKIDRVYLSTNKDVLDKFIKKYPNVVIKVVEN